MNKSEMEEMAEEDDMVIVIVGKEEVIIPDIIDPEVLMPSPLNIKLEPQEEKDTDVNDILENATKHGEFIPIKTETEDVYDEVEFLDEDESYEVPYDFLNHLKQERDSEEEGFIPDGYIPLPKPPKKKKRIRGLKKKVQVEEEDSTPREPLIKKLRLEYPEMKKNPSLIVDHLAKVMKELRPPPPPPNFYEIVKEEDDDTVMYKCTFCKEKSTTIPVAGRHYQGKHGKRYLECYACGANYKITANLYKHEKRCRSADANLVLKARGRYLGRKGKGRPFRTQGKFGLFEGYPAKPKGRFYCNKCPASYRHLPNLLAHDNSHVGLRPFHCERCPAAYTSEYALKRHLQTHGEVQFICDDCGREFKIKSLLVSHLNTHRPLRKHPCPHCPRRFAQKTALRHHVNRKHLNLPPAHGCAVCPKRFARMTNVRDHMKRAHGLMMITRRMYYKVLPTLPEMEVQNAKVVFNTDTNVFYPPNNFLEEPQPTQNQQIQEMVEKKLKNALKKCSNPVAEETKKEFKEKVKKENNRKVNKKPRHDIKIIKERETEITEDYKIITEDDEIITEDVKIITEDVKIITEDVKIITKDDEIITEDDKVITEDVKESENDVKVIKRRKAVKVTKAKENRPALDVRSPKDRERMNEFLKRIQLTARPRPRLIKAPSRKVK